MNPEELNRVIRECLNIIGDPNSSLKKQEEARKKMNEIANNTFLRDEIISNLKMACKDKKAQEFDINL